LEIEVYPNPAIDQIAIRSPVMITRVNIFDISGILLETIIGNDNTMSIKTNDYDTGMLLVEINTEKGTVRKKVLVN
jgi:hypothetical protein